MEEKYANGQIISRLQDGVLTYYLKDGKLKARGPLVDGMMDILARLGRTVADRSVFA
jgi:antitoxin component YwqK of YwqJK toxin-antitoxin module